MPHLRPIALRRHLRAGALILALVPAAATLTSCGFDYPTDRINTIAGGQNNRDADVDALGIRVLAYATGEGRLIGALSNNLKEVASLDKVVSEDGSATAADFAPVEVAASGAVNLSEDVFIQLSGSFTAGDVVPLALTFSTGETVTLNAPVVKPCYQYADIETEAPETAEPSESASADADAEAEAEAEAEAGEEASEGAAAEESAAEESAHAEETGAEHDARFNCSDVAPVPEGGGH